jgi:hypothetical protein
VWQESFITSILVQPDISVMRTMADLLS